MERIVLFDGVCNLCNNSVQFIIKRDPYYNFKFASLQSEFGKKLLKKYGISENLNSFVFIEGERVYFKSTAAIRVCTNLTGFWKLAGALKFIPSILRDPLYDFVAKNRYYWFGKSDSCLVPTPEMKKRFLD